MNLTRRVIAISVSIIGCGVLAYLSLQGSEVALASLTGIMGIVVGFYFGTTKTP